MLQTLKLCDLSRGIYLFVGSIALVVLINCTLAHTVSEE